MSRRSKKKPAPLPRLTSARIQRGWPGPNGTTIRFARPEEAAAVEELVTLTDVALEDEGIAAIESGTAGTMLLRSIDSGHDALLRDVAEAAHSGRLMGAIKGLSVALVAADSDGKVVASLATVPPGMLFDAITNVMGTSPQALLSLIAVTKIKALAVAPDCRSHRIGEALLRRYTQVYTAAGYRLLYGEFAIGSGLERYYSRLGFQVLDPGDSVDIGSILVGRPINLGADRGEQLFYRWRL